MLEHKLPDDVKKTWIDALRSGNYIQNVGSLKSIMGDSDTCGYCCLGVMHDALGGGWTQSESDPTYFGFGFTNLWGNKVLADSCLINDHETAKYESTVITPAIRAALMQPVDPWDTQEPTVQNYLMNMNDEMFKTFDEIADWIEKNL